MDAVGDGKAMNDVDSCVSRRVGANSTGGKVPRVIIAASWVIAAAGSPSVLAGEIQLLGSVSYTSDYVHRGLTQSSGQPAIQAGAGLRIPEGLYFNAWGSTIDIHRLGPDFGDGSGLELDLLAGFARPLAADWHWDVNLGRYIYFADHRGLDYNYTELSAALAYRDRLRLSVDAGGDGSHPTRPAAGARRPAHGGGTVRRMAFDALVGSQRGCRLQRFEGGFRRDLHLLERRG